MNKYSFVIEFDEKSESQINKLWEYLSERNIKFHVLKSDKELKENQKYKEVINKAINKLETDIEFCENDSQGVYDLCNIAIAREKKILNILKEVEDK